MMSGDSVWLQVKCAGKTGVKQWLGLSKNVIFNNKWASSDPNQGTQFTYFTGTKVQKLTQETLLGLSKLQNIFREKKRGAAEGGAGAGGGAGERGGAGLAQRITLMCLLKRLRGSFCR